MSKTNSKRKTTRKKADRPPQFNVLLSDEEREQARVVATEHGLGGIGPALKFCLRKEFRRLSRGNQRD